jgi:hypothetical protein
MEEREDRKKKEKKEIKLTQRRRVSLGLNPPFWLCSRSQLSGAIKRSFVDQSLNFFMHVV